MQQLRDEFIVDKATIIVIFAHYLKELIGLQLFRMNEVIRAHRKIYDVVRCILHDLHRHEMDANSN